MAVLVTGGYGIPKQASARGGWTVSYGFGGYIFTGLRIYRTSFRPDTVFATIGDSTAVVSFETIATVATRQPVGASSSRENVTALSSRENRTGVSSRRRSAGYSSREATETVASVESTPATSSTENDLTVETVDPAELREE